MLKKLLEKASEKGAVETLIDLLIKLGLSEEEAYLLLALASVELTKE